MTEPEPRPIHYGLFEVSSPHVPKINPQLAKEIGLHESLILTQLAFFLRTSKHEHDGRYWVYKTASDMQKEWFPYLERSALTKLLQKLTETMHLLDRRNDLNKRKGDRTYWYSLNIEYVSRLKNVVLMELDDDAMPTNVKISQWSTQSNVKISPALPDTTEDPYTTPVQSLPVFSLSSALGDRSTSVDVERAEFEDHRLDALHYYDAGTGVLDFKAASASVPPTTPSPPAAPTPSPTPRARNPWYDVVFDIWHRAAGPNTDMALMLQGKAKKGKYAEYNLEIDPPLTPEDVRAWSKWWRSTVGDGLNMLELLDKVQSSITYWHESGRPKPVPKRDPLAGDPRFTSPRPSPAIFVPPEPTEPLTEEQLAQVHADADAMRRKMGWSKNGR